MTKHKTSYVKDPAGVTHVTARPRDEDGKPLQGRHYLKPERLAPRFATQKSDVDEDTSLKELLAGA